MTPEQLIGIAVPAIDRALRMWGPFSPSREEKLALAGCKNALTSGEGFELAERISKHVPSFLDAQDETSQALKEAE